MVTFRILLKKYQGLSARWRKDMRLWQRSGKTATIHSSRRFASNIVNKITSRLVGVKLKDYGCMLRAYSRPVIDHINMCTESSSFIPALANTFARKIVEIEVAHEERKKGQSKYSIFKLLRLNFDLMTSFSLLPIQFIGVLGSVIALLGLFFALFLFIRRLIIGPSQRSLYSLRNPFLLHRYSNLCPWCYWRVYRENLPGSPQKTDTLLKRNYFEGGRFCLS